MKEHGLGRSERLPHGKDFNRVFSQGKRTANPEVILWTCSRDSAKSRAARAQRVGGAGRSPRGAVPAEGPSRLGIVVSRRLGRAVARNRLKRLIREAFRLNKGRLKRGVDLVVYPRPGCSWKTLQDAEAALIRIWKRAGVSPR